MLSHLVKDMDRHIERQWERANKENQPRPIPAADKERLETLKVWSACFNIHIQHSCLFCNPGVQTGGCVY